MREAERGGGAGASPAKYVREQYNSAEFIFPGFPGGRVMKSNCKVAHSFIEICACVQKHT